MRQASPKPRVHPRPCSRNHRVETIVAAVVFWSLSSGAPDHSLDTLSPALSFAGLSHDPLPLSPTQGYSEHQSLRQAAPSPADQLPCSLLQSAVFSRGPAFCNRAPTLRSFLALTENIASFVLIRIPLYSGVSVAEFSLPVRIPVIGHLGPLATGWRHPEVAHLQWPCF